MAKAPVDELDLDPLIRDAIEENTARWAESTYDNRTSQLRKFDRWCKENGYHVRDMEAKDVAEFFRHLNQEGYASGTIEGYYEAVRVLFNELTGILDEREEHPYEDLDKRKYVNGEERKHDLLEESYLTEDEVKELAENVPSPRVRNELLVKLMFQTGIRASEASDIQLRHIDRDEQTIRVRNRKKENPSKEDQYRTVVYYPERNGVGSLLRMWLDAGRRRALSKYASESDYLFISERSPKLPPDRIIRIIRQAAENAELQEIMYEDQAGNQRHKVTAHTLRHSHAVYALRSGIDIRTLQEHLGHESIDQTEKYLRIVSDDVEQTFRRRWGVPER